MATARDIRRRIRSVKNIAKVTGALETVAASRVRKAQNQALATRAYAEAALGILRDIGKQQRGDSRHPYLEERSSVRSIAIVLMTSDRGLAGPYNANMIRKATEFEKQQSVPVHYITIGRKGRDWMLRRGARIIADFADLPATPSILDITVIARTAVDDFLSQQVDEVFLAYTLFLDALHHEPHIERLLPLQPIHSEESADSVNNKQPFPSSIYSYEPDPDSILWEILPRFTELQIFHALLEALASEHTARMMAMRHATENANALVSDLTLSYNKARQLAITSEILDIVGGAEALL
ncbi:MAG: ATP synthase F1 subunit gamma [Anaerolineae bacterium]|nr:ATP synthase F1 subunit gamma [Anaerolineae bacterium]